MADRPELKRSRWISDEAYPVYVMRFPASHTHPELVAEYEELLRIAASLTQDCAFIVDLGPLKESSAKDRAHIAQVEAKINAMPSACKHCRGLAIIVHGTWQKGVVTAVNWLVRRPYPVKVFTDDAAAMKWTESQLGIERSSTWWGRSAAPGHQAPRYGMSRKDVG